MSGILLMYVILIFAMAIQLSVNRISRMIIVKSGAISVLISIVVALVMRPIANSTEMELVVTPIANSTEMELALVNPNATISNILSMCLIITFFTYLESTRTTRYRRFVLEFNRRFLFGFGKEIIICAILVYFYWLMQPDNYLSLALSPPVLLGAIFVPSLLFLFAKLGVKSIFAPILAMTCQGLVAYLLLFHFHYENEEYNRTRLATGFALAFTSQVVCVALFTRIQFESSFNKGGRVA